MPPKTSTCVICNQTVLKAQTFARADGSRACRSHEGVSEDAQRLAEAEKLRLQRDINNPKRLFPIDFGPDPMAEKRMADVYSHCWVCDREGLEMQEFQMHVLIAMERLNLRGEFNLLTYPTKVRELMGDVVALIMVPYKEPADRAMKHRIKDPKLREILHFLGSMLLCGHCINQYGYQSHLEAVLPRPTFDQVMAFMPVSEAIRPLLRQIAEKTENQS